MTAGRMRILHRFRFGSAGTSATQFGDLAAREQAELSALLQEIVAVKAEIVSRLNAQLAINGGNVVLTSALLTVALTQKSHASTFVLAIPLVSVAGVGMFFSQDAMIIAGASYLDRVLRPRVVALVKSPSNVEPILISWESYLNKWRSAGGKLFWPLGAFGPLLTLSPAVTILVGYVAAWISSRRIRAETHSGEIALWAISFTLVGTMYFIGRRLNNAYLAIDAATQ